MNQYSSMRSQSLSCITSSRTTSVYFAAMHTKIDSFIKRGKKGYLFTIGDEPVPGDLTKEQIEIIRTTHPKLYSLIMEE